MFPHTLDLPLDCRVAEAVKFVGLDTLVFENIQDQQLVRIFEEPGHEMSDFRSRSFFAFDQRHVNVGTAVFDMLNVAFGFEDPNCGQDGVVGQRRLFRQAVENLLTVAEPFSHSTSINLNSASVRVSDFLGGTDQFLLAVIRRSRPAIRQLIF